MKDLSRSKVKPFNGQGSGYVANQWLIALDRIFSMQDLDSNFKTRFSITHLENFGPVGGILRRRSWAYP